MGFVKNYFRFRFIMVRHSLAGHRREHWRYGGFGLFFLFVAVFLFVFLLKAFRFFRSFEIVGDLVIMKLLSTIFFVFFVFLILSNINSIVKWFYTREDLPFILTNPISSTELFITRSAEALFESSWAFLIFALPVLAAYYTAVGRVDATAPVACALLVPFVLLPHGIASVIVILLGRFLSPKIIKNTFSVLSLVLIAVLVSIFRAIRIEKLVQPESFAQLYEYMRFLALPSHPLIPTSPFIEVITYPVKQGSLQVLLVDVGFFLSSAALVATLSYWVHRCFFLRSYSNMRGASARVKRDVLKRLFAFLPLKTRNLFLKDLKNIQRDPKEWSQVFLILALIVVYVYNFKLFPRDRSPLPTLFLESLLAFLNMGLLTFVISAISVRFVYPSFQLEGRPFWFFLTSPVSLDELYRKKLGLFLPPILILALTLNYLSNLYIGPPAFLYWLSFGYVVLVSLLSPVFSLYMGTKQIDFRETPNPYGGTGGITSMLIMFAFAGITLGLLGWSSASLVVSLQRKIPLPLFLQVRFAFVCVAIGLFSLVALRHLVRRTLANLRTIEL